MIQQKRLNLYLLQGINKTTLYVISSVIAIGLTYKYFIFPLAWIAIVPFLLALQRKTPKQAFFIGASIGGIAGSYLFSWMHKVTQHYTGSQTQLGLILLFSSALYFSLQFGLFAFLYSWIFNKKNITKTQKQTKEKHKFILPAISVALLWVLIEWGSSLILNGLPWLGYNLVHSQTTDLYMIQTASCGGQWIISFWVMLINYAIFYTIITRNIKFTLYASGLLLVLHIQGYAAIKIIDAKQAQRKTKVTYITGNIKPELKYSKQHTDSLQNLYYRLNKEATKHKPELILWTESSSPWAFSLDNGFLENVLNITYASKAYHLFGINIPDEKDTSMFYNSATFITYDGAMRARYDKTQLLSLLEEPLSDSFLSLRGNKSERFRKSKFNKPLKTPLGVIGTFICNESLFPNIARSHTRQGAAFLTLMSNDSWFTETRLAFHHFYISRLRAVENRRDLLINSNGGYSGMVASSGRINDFRLLGDACVINEEVKSFKDLSFYTRNGDWFVWLAFLVVGLSVFKRYK